MQRFVNRFRGPVRVLPGLAGLVLVSWGASLVFLPAGLIVAGLLCLCVDYRL